MKKKKNTLLTALFVILICVTLVACSAPTRTANDSAPPPVEALSVSDSFQFFSPDAEVEVEEEWFDDGWDFDDVEVEEAMFFDGDDEAPSPNGSLGNATSPSDRIIYRANADIITTDFDGAIVAIHRLINEYEGFIEQHSMWGEGQGNQQNRHAMFTLRIPTNQYQSTILRLDEFGSVMYMSSTATNVSAQYIDIESRLNALRSREGRILGLMELATDMEDLITLERELSDIIRQIESLTTDRTFLDNQIAFSTIHLAITEVTEEEEIIIIENPAIHISDAGNAFTDSVQAMGTFFTWLVVVMAALLPWLLVFGAIALVILLVLRRYIKKRIQAKKEAAKNQPPKNQDFLHQYSSANTHIVEKRDKV